MSQLEPRQIAPLKYVALVLCLLGVTTLLLRESSGVPEGLLGLTESVGCSWDSREHPAALEGADRAATAATCAPLFHTDSANFKFWFSDREDFRVSTCPSSRPASYVSVDPVAFTDTYRPTGKERRNPASTTAVIASVYSQTPGSRAQALQAAGRYIEQAAEAGADLIVFPEVFFGGCDPTQPPAPACFDEQEKLLAFCSSAAAQHAMWVVCTAVTVEVATGVARRCDARFFNSAIVFDRTGRRVARQDKMFPVVEPRYGIANEAGYTPSLAGVQVFDTDFGARVGVAICNDVFFPEVWAQLAGLGADVVLWPAAWRGGAHLPALALQYGYYIVNSPAEDAVALVADPAGRLVPPPAALLAAAPGVRVARLETELVVIHDNFRGRMEQLLADLCGRVQVVLEDATSQLVVLAPAPTAGAPVYLRAALHDYEVLTLRELAQWMRHAVNGLRAGRRAVPARPARECESALDCSLNGACSAAGVCVCDPGWGGPACSRLLEGRSRVLWPQAEAQPRTAGWGASLAWEAEAAQWHMWVTVVEQASAAGEYLTCFHTQGTQIVHAVAAAGTGPAGPYTLADIALTPETNNPHVVRLASGAWLLYHLNDNVATPPLAGCTGVGADAGCSAARTGSTTPCGRPGEGTIGVAVSTAGPAGPWEVHYPMCDIGQNYTIISNPSAVVLAGDEILLAMRYSHGVHTNASEAIAVLRAKSWEGPYHVVSDDLPPIGVDLRGSEDPFLFQNSHGFHILVHQYNRTAHNCSYGNPCMVPGGHYYSADGEVWHPSPYPAYTSRVQWYNGTTVDLNYRERPELLLNEDGHPQFLITGGEWGYPKYEYPEKGGPCQSVAMITDIEGAQ